MHTQKKTAQNEAHSIKWLYFDVLTYHGYDDIWCYEQWEKCANRWNEWIKKGDC